MGGARTCGDPGWERGGGSLGEWVGDFSLDFGGDEVDLLAVLVHHNRIASGPRVRAQDDPVLRRERVCWLSACPIPQVTLLIPPQSHAPAHLEHKARDGGSGLVWMRDPEAREDSF